MALTVFPIGCIASYGVKHIPAAYSIFILLSLSMVICIIFKVLIPLIKKTAIREAGVVVNSSRPIAAGNISFSTNNDLIPDYEESILAHNPDSAVNESNSEHNYEGRLKNIFENIKLGIAAIDVSSKIIMFNPAFEKITGFNGQELHKKKFTDLLHGDDYKSSAGVIFELLAGTREHLDTEIRLVDKQGQVIWVHMAGSTVRNSESRQYNIIVIDNITERKEADKTKDAFVDMVAHELKNPLMAMISSLRLAKKQGQFPDVLHELVGIASDSAESLWSILENLLEVSRAKAGRLKLASVRSNIKQLIGEVVANTRQTLIHRISTDIPDNLPPVVVDPPRIQLILRNLLDNAIKYSPKGGNITVFIRHSEEEVVVGVKDEGIGISPDNQQNLFQPFERLGAKNTMGSGLGLAVCKLLIKHHNGNIWVESEPGKGSTFYFSLPLGIT